jgi:hypothetical protein
MDYPFYLCHLHFGYPLVLQTDNRKLMDALSRSWGEALRALGDATTEVEVRTLASKSSDGEVAWQFESFLDADLRHLRRRRRHERDRKLVNAPGWWVRLGQFDCRRGPEEQGGAVFRTKGFDHFGAADVAKAAKLVGGGGSWLGRKAPYEFGEPARSDCGGFHGGFFGANYRHDASKGPGLPTGGELIPVGAFLVLW